MSGEIPPLAAAWPLRINEPAGRRLRIERRRLALIVAIGDLSGALDLTAVTSALTDFADHALHTAIETAIEERTPGAPLAGFTALALGKQGSRELNYSSDIDPILLYDPTSLPTRPREAPNEAAVRIARRVVELLQARDGDGYVLRVDLRLRPSPEATPIALPIDAAISYYESLALPWERAAFIRARAAAGDLALGQRFLNAIEPFVWRRGLDFGAIGEMRAISRRVRDHYDHGQELGAGFDLKRGRGGIREAEFFAQIHQLIHGGRDPSLRRPATRDALAALATVGWITPDEAATMTRSYTLLRTIEHRVQMIDDRQTHRLPEGAALDGVARLHGLENGAALLALLSAPVTAAAALYDSLEPPGRQSLALDAPSMRAQLAAAGFSDEADAASRIMRWRGGAYPALRSPAAREALEAVLPGLITAMGAAPDAQAAIVRLDLLLSRLSSAVNLFRLVEARPALARLLGTILSHAPTLSESLGLRPALFDGLIDNTALQPVGSVPELAYAMDCLSNDSLSNSYEARLDRVRRIVGEKRFALGTQIIAAIADPLAAGAGYGRLAEAAVQVLADAAIDEFVLRHGSVLGSELVILALGRLGGGVLTHASDLDLVYLFTGDYLSTSDGEKPLGAVLYYNRLAQRVSMALSTPTAAGRLYDVDTRLRPSGAQGPLVVSLEGFERYQRENAWTWEHMALLRARPIFGSAAARDTAQRVIDRVLGGDRAARDVVGEARAMRAEVSRHKPSSGPLDVKLLPGGLVDLEFAVQTLQLQHRTAFSPDLATAISKLVAQNLAPTALGAANAFLTRLLVTLRLVAPDNQAPATATRRLIAEVLQLPDWAAVLALLARTRQEVEQFRMVVLQET